MWGGLPGLEVSVIPIDTPQPQFPKPHTQCDPPSDPPQSQVPRPRSHQSNPSFTFGVDAGKKYSITYDVLSLLLVVCIQLLNCFEIVRNMFGATGSCLCVGLELDPNWLAASEFCAA